MPTLSSSLRLLALCLLLQLIPHAQASEKLSKDDLDVQKELLQLKIDSGKEALQKDIDAFGKRVDALDKRVDDQVNRFGDLGLFAGLISTLITVLLAAGGLFGYFSVKKKAREEAEEVAETTSKKWFDENHQKLSDRIRELENAAAQAHMKIDSSVADVDRHKNNAIETMQSNMTSGTDNTQKVSEEDAAGLRTSVKQLKDKPEANYSFDDWNTRAFAAYQAKQFEDAALFWKYAAEVPNAGAKNTAQTLVYRAVALRNLKRHEEAIITCNRIISNYASDATPAIREQVAKAMLDKGFNYGLMGDKDKAIDTYAELIDTYRADPAPAIREQVTKAMVNKGVTHGQMGDNDKAIATYDQVIDTYRADPAPAIREKVATAMSNKGVTHGQMGNNDKAIATYEQVIDTYRADPVPAIREKVATAMFNKGVTHGQMGNNDKAIATFDQVIGTYSADPAPTIREQVAAAQNGRGFTFLIMAKQALAKRNKSQANELLHRAKTDLLEAIKPKSLWGMALGNLAYTLWLQEEPGEAENTFRSALNDKEFGGETLYKSMLDDIALHPIPEDAGFGEMVERLWAEYQAQKRNEN